MMKQANVQIGATYETRIGEEIARVVVVRMVTELTRGAFGSKRNQTRFEVRREGESKPLPKLRAASALRPV